MVYDFCSLDQGSFSSRIHLQHFGSKQHNQILWLLSPSSHLHYHLVIIPASLAYESWAVISNNQFTKIHTKIVTKD
jgi:hypothetical protein